MESYLNSILICLILVIILIIVLNNRKNKCLNEEGFLVPQKKHVPRNFELYEINHKNKYISFIFNSPRPYIIGNIVKKYELILISYRKEDSNKHHNTVIHIKDLKDCEPNSEELHRKGKYIFKIRLPQMSYEEMEEDGSLSNKPLNYKVGLRAIYTDDVSSDIVQTVNQNLFELGSSFNYKENMYLLELGKEFRDRMKLENEKINEKKDEIPIVDPQYERMAERLGGFPDNLELKNERTLEELLKLNFARGSLNARVNKGSFTNI